jgi:hypothetical protein
MTKLGILVHGYHLEAPAWDVLVWGDPARNVLGSFPILAELLLHRMQSDEVVSVVLGGTADIHKGGLSHGEYTKKYVIGRFDELDTFPRLKRLLQSASADEMRLLRDLFQSISIADVKNTTEEIAFAARSFTKLGVREVIQIAAASHAPRCTQLQLLARAETAIPEDQLWFLRASDACHAGATPLSTAVMEPPHRGDDPMLGFHPTLPEVMKPYYYGLSGDDKKELIGHIDEFMQGHATQDDIRKFSPHKK